jgi:hypothetical protein
MNIRDFIESSAPGLMDFLQPTIFQAPPGYPNLNDLAYRLCIGIQATRAYTSGGTVPPPTLELADAYMTVAKAGHDGMPTIFVTRGLLTELLTTNLPASASLSKLPWPSEALLFVLPTGFLISPSEGDCPFLGVARFAEDEEVALSQFGCPRLARNQPGFCVFTASTTNQNPNIISARVDFNTHPTTDAIPPTLLDKYTSTSLDPRMSPDDRLKRADVEFAEFLLEIALKLICHLDAHPERYTQGGNIIRDGRITVYSPNLIS